MVWKVIVAGGKIDRLRRMERKCALFSLFSFTHEEKEIWMNCSKNGICFFKKKLSEKDDILPHFENFLNYSSNESYIVYKNCTPHGEVGLEESEFANTLPSKEPEHAFSSVIFVTIGMSSANTRDGFSPASIVNDSTRGRDEAV